MRNAGRALTWTLTSVLTLAALQANAASSRTPDSDRPNPESPRTSGPIAVAPARDLVYVADFGRDRVDVTTREGAVLRSWGGSGSGPGEFRGPAGIAVDGAGFVYVADHYNHRVQKFTAEGEWLACWGTRGAGPKDLGGPLGIAIAPDGAILVTELDNHRVHRFSSDGATLGTWGRRGHGSGELQDPWGIAVDDRGTVYVADHGNDRVARFSKDGAWLGTSQLASAEGESLDGPTAIALGTDGSIHVDDLLGTHVCHLDREGHLHATGEASSSAAVTAARDVPSTAASGRFEMSPVNPALSPGTVVLRFAIPVRGDVLIEVFSVDGRRVHRRAIERCEPGEHTVSWVTRTDDDVAAPAGVYFARVRFDDGARQEIRTGRIVVLR